MPDITYTLIHDTSRCDDEWVVKETDWNGYPEHSVLSGQPIVMFKGSFETKEEALVEFPEARTGGAGLGKNYFNHLSDENDYSTRYQHDTWEDGD